MEKWEFQRNGWLYYAREPFTNILCFLFYHFFLYLLHPILSCIYEQLVNEIEMRYSLESHICMIRVCLCFRLCCLVVIQFFSLRSYDCVEACRHFTMGECGVIIITCTSFFPRPSCVSCYSDTHTHIRSLCLSLTHWHVLCNSHHHQHHHHPSKTHRERKGAEATQKKVCIKKGARW